MLVSHDNIQPVKLSEAVFKYDPISLSRLDPKHNLGLVATIRKEVAAKPDKGAYALEQKIIKAHPKATAVFEKTKSRVSACAAAALDERSMTVTDDQLGKIAQTIKELASASGISMKYADGFRDINVWNLVNDAINVMAGTDLIANGQMLEVPVFHSLKMLLRKSYTIGRADPGYRAEFDSARISLQGEWRNALSRNQLTTAFYPVREKSGAIACHGIVSNDSENNSILVIRHNPQKSREAGVPMGEVYLIGPGTALMLDDPLNCEIIIRTSVTPDKQRGTALSLKLKMHETGAFVTAQGTETPEHYGRILAFQKFFDGVPIFSCGVMDKCGVDSDFIWCGNLG